jgi:N4-gp56 family major capsid protein
VADQKTTDAALSNAVNTYYEKKILEDFEPDTYFYQLAPTKVSMPQGSGKTIEFTRYNKIGAKYNDDADELTNYQTYLSAEVVSATVRERSNYVQLSSFVSLTAISDPLDQAMRKLKFAAAKTLDILIRNDLGFVVADVAAYSSVNAHNLAIDGGTLNSSGITVRIWSADNQIAAASRTKGFDLWHDKADLANSGTVVAIAKSGMTIKTLQSAVNELQGRDVPTIDGAYHAIMHPTVAYQLTTTAGFKGWFSPTSAEAAKMAPGEMGIVAGVRIHRSTNVARFPLTGDTLATSSGAIFGTLLFGDEAYGAVDIAGANGRQGFNLYLKESGKQSTNDPANKIKTAAYRLYAAGRILNKDSGLWIVTTEQV